MKRTIARAVGLLLACATVHAYSVLSHQAIIDSAWDANIRPLLVKRFPQATGDDLKRAHANADAGCIIQDMGTTPSAATSSAISCTTCAAATLCSTC